MFEYEKLVRNKVKYFFVNFETWKDKNVESLSILKCHALNISYANFNTYFCSVQFLIWSKSSHYLFTALLIVGKEEKLLQGKDENKDHLLDVTKSDVYYGGIPPTVDVDMYRRKSK